MLSAYFPFTYVSEAAAKKISFLLGRFLLYQPVGNLSLPSMLKLHDDRLIAIRTPNRSYDDKINAILDNYSYWASIHSKNRRLDTNLIRVISKTVPFHEDDSISGIQQSIGSVWNSDSEDVSSNVLLESCLFLALAQRNDFQRDQLRMELEKVKIKEKYLKKILQSELKSEFKNEINDSSSIENDFGVFMCSKRIKTWAELVLLDKKLPDFLVTDSLFTIESLLNMGLEFEVFDLPLHSEIGVNNRRMCDANRIEKISNLIHQNDLSEHGGFSSKSMDVFSIQEKENLNKMYVIPGLSLKTFLTNIAPKDLSRIDLGEEKDIGNTVISYIG